MKSIYSLIVLILCLFTSAIFAREEKNLKDAEVAIKNARESIRETLESKKLRNYLPYSFSKSYEFLDKAQEFMKKEEAEWAVYYAEMAGIYARMALFRSKKNELAWERKKLEVRSWKLLANSGTKEELYQKKIKKLKSDLFLAKMQLIMAELGIRQLGKSYILTIEDKTIFVRRTLSLSPEGKKLLKKVSRFVNLNPNMMITIQGHTARRDRDNGSSTAKANSVRVFFLNFTDIPPSKIHIEAYGNRKPLIENGRPVRGSKNDRIELIFKNLKK